MRSPVGPFRARRWRCLSEDIDQESFAHKHTELRDRLASIKLKEPPPLGARSESGRTGLLKHFLQTRDADKRRSSISETFAIRSLAL
jgi:hypothetical protein